jgi:serine/threonine protein kinase
MDAHILHRDVSPENITISTTKQEGVPRGFLIDLDVAICVDEAQPKGGERHGTRPFMAIGVLRTKKHTYKHDLESLFYCFLWVAICGKGKTWPPQGSKLWAWTQASFRECASHKSAFEEAEGFEYVLDEFTQDFVHCKELARELWRIFFFVGSGHDGNDPDICYQAVLRAFRDAGAEAKSFCQDGQY